MNANQYIGKSNRGGKYHICTGETVSNCNHSGQSRRATRYIAASEAELLKAVDSDFCAKCLPSAAPNA